MRCIELFAGAGGAALGLEAAGFEHAALCEWDSDACATLRAAGLGPVVEGDVRDLDAIAETAGTEPVDLVWSSFPCQAWSQAGARKGAQDERNGWPWTVDALDRFRPRWFLGENVYGLLTHSTEGHPDPYQCPRCYFENVILAQLQARFAHVGWWLLDAADYGVPQHRRRVILWAGPVLLQSPRPTHGAPLAARQVSMWGPTVQPWVTMGEALGIDVGEVVAAGETGEGRPRPLSQSAPTIGTKGTAYLLRPSPTVSAAGECKGSGAGANPQKMQRASDALFLATGRRRLTVAECATLQGFPDAHPWQGAKTARYRQVGNAVPPRLAEVVGRAVVNAGARPDGWG